MTQHLHAATQASAWVMRWSHLIPRHGKVLDLACGHGRHMQWLKQQGFDCMGVDRDAQALESAKAFGEVVQADVEIGGTDQLFNILVGRDLQKEEGQPEQDPFRIKLTTPSLNPT